MKTLYIDVYFMINFTVDALAIYFAASLSKVLITVRRLILASLVGGVYAVFGILLLGSSLWMYPISVVIFVLIVIISAGRVSLYRKIRFAIAFLLCEIMIGGLVYYGYCLLDRFVRLDELGSLGAENRNLIILSLIILLSLGVLKLVSSIFQNSSSERVAHLCISYKGVKTEFDALVDSGNLARDPFDKTPVTLISPRLSEKIFGIDAIALYEPEKAGVDARKRIRIIPVVLGGESSVLYGMRVDEIYLVKGKKQECVHTILAINKGVDNYGGYSALVPLTVLEGIK